MGGGQEWARVYKDFRGQRVYSGLGSQGKGFRVYTRDFRDRGFVGV